MISSNSWSEQVDAMWYAVYTRYRHEKNVERILNGKGFETFLPLYEASHRWADRLKLVSLPLFPCYVFLKADVTQIFKVLTTPGIHNFVLSAGHPAVIPDGEIENIRRGIKSGARVQPHEFLANGEQVRVKAGPLEGIEGILVRKKNSCRLLLSVEMLGKSVAVEIDATEVERLKERISPAVPRKPQEFFNSPNLNSQSGASINPESYAARSSVS